VYRFWVLMSGLIRVLDSVLWCIFFLFFTCCHPCLCSCCVPFSSSVFSLPCSTSLASVQNSTSLSYLLCGAYGVSCRRCGGLTKGVRVWWLGGGVGTGVCGCRDGDGNGGKSNWVSPGCWKSSWVWILGGCPRGAFPRVKGCGGRGNISSRERLLKPSSLL